MRGAGRAASVLALLMFGQLVGPPAHADGPVATVESDVKEGAQATGHAIVKGAHAVGHGISTGAHAVGHGIKRGAQDVGHAFGGNATRTGSGGATEVPPPPKLPPPPQ
jgi:hypothetical protein